MLTTILDIEPTENTLSHSSDSLHTCQIAVVEYDPTDKQSIKLAKIRIEAAEDVLDDTEKHRRLRALVDLLVSAISSGLPSQQLTQARK